MSGRIMKTLPLRFVKGRRTGPNSSVGDHYKTRCPYCRREALLWPSELKSGRTPADMGNCCEHAERLTKGGSMIFRPKMSVVEAGPRIRINGVLIDKSIGEILAEMDTVKDDAEHGQRFYPPAYAPARRFDAVLKAVETLWRRKPDAYWSALQDKLTEERERAELARLKAKYES